MAKSSADAAIGLRVHSGWAALVVVAGSSDAAEVIAKRRIEICDPRIRGSKQPYHAAEPMEFADAKVFLEHCEQSTQNLAREAIQAAIAGLRDRGAEPHSCSILLASGRQLPDLAAILRSHALIHTAEGEFYRKAMTDAAEYYKLRVFGIKERELYDDATRNLKRTRRQIDSWIAEMGKKLGPPWTQDQKLAALAARIALKSR